MRRWGGLCPHLGVVSRGPRVIATHGSSKGSALVATISVRAHMRQKRGTLTKGGGKEKTKRGRSPANRRSNTLGHDKNSDCRFHLKGRCCKGTHCAQWRSSHCRFFKKGESSAGGTCQSAHKQPVAPRAPEDEAGGGKVGEGKKPKPLTGAARHRMAPWPVGPPSAVCLGRV